LDLDDPMRDPTRVGPGGFEGFARPHRDVCWIIISIAPTSLNPGCFRRIVGVWLATWWGMASHRSGLTERAVVETMWRRCYAPAVLCALRSRRRRMDESS
jgi:hypothetical protein